MPGFLIGAAVVATGALAWDWRRSSKLKKALAAPTPYPNSPGADGDSLDAAVRSRRSTVAGQDPAVRQYLPHPPDLPTGGFGNGGF